MTRYAIKFLITNLLTITLLVIVATFLGIGVQVFYVASSFALLRQFAGGRHVKSPELCIITTVMSITIISLYSHLLIDYLLIISLVSILLIIIYAPYIIRKNMKITKNRKWVFKSISIGLIFLSIFFNNIYCAVAFLFEAFSLIHLKGGELD
ncbi:MAG: accessory gene regulator B family protein [Bacillota bacterium]